MREAAQVVEKRKYVHVSLSPQVLRTLRVYCERRGLTISEVVRRALDMYFDYEREKGRL